MDTYPGVTDGDVSITVGTDQIAGWETVEITRSSEAFPSHFELTMTEQFTDDPGRILAQPGKRCQIKIGKDVVLTGFIDRYAATISGTAHDVTISGRGLCEDLVDCSADIRSATSPVKGGSTDATSCKNLAEKLCQPWGIEVSCAVSDLGTPIRTFQVGLGETPYEVIERVARYSGFLVYEDEYGGLVLDRLASKQHQTGFVQGQNVEHAAISIAVDERYTSLDIVYTPIGQLSEGPGPDLTNQRAHVDDPMLAAEPLNRFRPRIVASLQTDSTPDYADRMAVWEMNRRRGRSQAVHLTCDRWRDKSGRLWQPNWLAQVHLPALKVVNQMWAIGTVIFRRDATGTHAELTLMPPEAFSVQPSPLNIWDLEYNAGAPPTSASPAPATTSPATGGFIQGDPNLDGSGSPLPTAPAAP
jgi:prophage tail gpP-like protein